MVMLAPIASRGARKFICRQPNAPGASAARADPWVTRSQLALYRIDALPGDRFSQIRSHWGSVVTRIYRNNPLIGLPNQHIVGLTYVP